MALPKEPRQKMINLMYLVLTAMLALNVSAEVIEAFKTVDKSLVTSNANIDNSNGTIFASLKAKLDDNGVDKDKLAKWTANANKAKSLSDALASDIDQLKADLKNASGLKPGTTDDYKYDDINASSRLFETEKKGIDLDNKLKAYKSAMLGIDSAIGRQFSSTFPIDVDDTKDATTPNFRMMPTVAAVTLLSKYQNNIKNAENKIVAFCHEQVSAVKLIFNKFEPIAASSSTYLMPGQEMTVTAGVGAFNDQSKPIITIDGASAPLNDNGVAEKKFNVSGAGAHKVHVSIAYTKPDGTPDHLEKDIDYVVGVPGGAAVMLDKMNVFYQDVDNPITISSGSGWDKTTVSMSGGTISGSGSNRIVRVGAGTTTASITVTADGHTSTFPFRVKRVPDPVFKVGDGKPRMASVAFKGQQYCRADLENFDFDLKFSVVSSTVYFSGANFPNVATGSINGNNLSSIQAFMQRCGPGSVITFDNVKVQGPGGVRIIDGKSIALY